MKIKNLIWMFLPLFAIACSDDDSANVSEDRRFNLQETNLSFTNEAATQSVGFKFSEGAVTAEVVSEDSDWCSVSVDNEKVNVTVQENILVTGRTATIEVTNGARVVSLLVRQAQKYFSTIAAVNDLTATSGAGFVNLKWTEPTDDNFSHVVLTYEKRGVKYKEVLEPGVTELVIKELFAADGKYTFNLQSVDKDDAYGLVASVEQVAGKLVALRFQKEITPVYFPYHYRTSNTQHIAKLRIGSAEFNDGQEIVVEFGATAEDLVAYNAEKGLKLEMLPEAAYTLPQGFIYNSQSDYQDLSITIDYSMLQDYKEYGLPLRIKSVSTEEVSEIMSVVVLRFIVDDFSGWYTVDRVSGSDEAASNYPNDPAMRRRYIKRSGLNTWETGYLFKNYVNSENHVSGGIDQRQYIVFDPATKIIYIRQADYVTKEDLTTYDAEKQEINSNYQYTKWNYWRVKEKMYNRSFTK